MFYTVFWDPYHVWIRELVCRIQIRIIALKIMNFIKRKASPPMFINFGDFWPTSEPLSAVLATNVLPWTHSTILVKYVWIVCYKRKNDFLRSFLQFLAKIVIDVCTSVSFFSATKLSKWRNWIYAILNFTIVQSCIYIFQIIMQILTITIYLYNPLSTDFGKFRDFFTQSAGSCWRCPCTRRSAAAWRTGRSRWRRRRGPAWSGPQWWWSSRWRWTRSRSFGQCSGYPLIRK